MTWPEVEVDAELARAAERIAESNGERLQDVVERLLREYVAAAQGDR